MIFHSWQRRDTFKLGCEAGSSISDKSAGRLASDWPRECTGVREQVGGLTPLWANKSEEVGRVSSADEGSGRSSSSTLAHLK